VYFIVEPSRREFIEIARSMDATKVLPVVDAVFDLSWAAQAHQRGLSCHPRGKIVLQVAAQRALIRGRAGRRIVDTLAAVVTSST